MGKDLLLCQKEIRRLRCVVRIYESQMRELKSYLGQMLEDPLLAEEAKRAVREIHETWRRIQEDE